MAISLADLASTTTYREYCMACMEEGRTPMSQAEWVKAGKPSK